MNILVTGATGFIGNHLVKALVQQGHRCRCLIRKTSNNIKELKNIESIELVYGDITDKESLSNVARNIDVIYHLAAQLGKFKVRQKQYYLLNVYGTKNLLEIAMQSRVKQFIFCSTPGVQGFGNKQAKETDPYSPKGNYEISKCKAEKLVLKAAKNSNLKITILRPDFVYGPGDTRRIKLYQKIKNRKMYIIGNGASLLRPTYISDVVSAFLLVLNNKKAFNQTYNIAGEKLITVKEYMNTVANCLNVEIPKIKIPKWLANIAAVIAEPLSIILKREPLITKTRIDFLTTDHGTDIAKAEKDIGYVPRYTFREGMKNTISWYKKNGYLCL